jgi:uncharacterized membrane protein YkvA (DUF1232 family)
MQTLSPEDLPKYEGNYSEKDFWAKLRRVASKAGSKLVYYALVLFYTLMDPATPVQYKAIIAGALGYLILPMDFIPDFLPFAGLVDDWAALDTALYHVVSSITPEIKERALEKTRSLFKP